MYFANNNGLLEYDGANWNTYPLPGNTKVRSVLPVGDTIYVGALGQFGRFVRNSKGRMVYQNLSGRLGEKEQINIWHIHRIGRDVYFQTDGTFYINDYKTRMASHPGIRYSTVVYNRLYITTSKSVSVLVGNQFIPLPGIDASEISSIVAILPWQQQLLLVTSHQGLFLYGNNKLQPFSIATDISNMQLSCAALSGATLALGTLQDGVILIDLNHHKTERISTNNGLQNKTVLSAFFDADRNLWLALDNGLDCVQLWSPLRFLNSRQSPIGSGNCSVNYQDRLYLGTNQGLYAMTDGKIRFIEGTGGQVLCLDTIGGELFCGGRQFFLSIDGQHVTHYNNRGVWAVRPLAGHPDVLLTSSYWGLRLMRRSSQGWRMAEEVKGANISAKTLYIEDMTNAVWVANKEKGLYRLALTPNLLQVSSKKCYNSAALPKGDNVCIAKIDGEMVIASRQGLFRYDAAHDQLVSHAALEKRLEGHTAYTFIKQTPDGNIWYATDGIIHLMRGMQKSGFLNDYLIEDFESVSHWGGCAIISTEEGFASLKDNQGDRSLIPSAEPRIKRQVPLVQPYIRKIYIGNFADTLYYGCQQPVQVKWGNNSIRLQYSASCYDPTQTVLYSYRLDGSSEKDWSPYSRSRIKEYTNLPEGDYTFRLRIITTDSQQPIETQFCFTILPPWYRSWWAYLLYVLLVIAGGYAGYRRLQKSRQQLIAQKNEQIQEKEEEIQTLREEKLEIELRSQKDELVRSRMNIVRKNEILQEIRKTAVSLNNTIPAPKDTKAIPDALATIKRRVVRLISQIDTNIEHDDDLEAFRDSFDAVHHNFLQLLGERYPELSHKEKMLCAYIRMGLQSKEIAPLQNISTRGVEISRYRIRQKLGLDTNVSLTEFLQHL